MTWVDAFTVKSASGNGEYTVSRQNGTGLWGCSCRGWTNNGNCKHLKARNLPSARGQASAPNSDSVTLNAVIYDEMQTMPIVVPPPVENDKTAIQEFTEGLMSISPEYHE